MAIDGAVPPASPIATPIRAITSMVKLAAKPQKMVMTLQAIQLKAMTFLRPIRSDRRPSGKPKRV